MRLQNKILPEKSYWVLVLFTGILMFSFSIFWPAASPDKVRRMLSFVFQSYHLAGIEPFHRDGYLVLLLVYQVVLACFIARSAFSSVLDCYFDLSVLLHLLR